MLGFRLVYVWYFCPWSLCNLVLANIIIKLTRQRKEEKRKPKKSTRRGRQMRNKTNKQTNKQTHKKIPGSGRIEFQS
jgi:hypothetical protein